MIRRLLYSWGADFVLKFVYEYCELRILTLSACEDNDFTRGMVLGFKEVRKYCSSQYLINKKKFISDIK